MSKRAADRTLSDWLRFYASERRRRRHLAEAVRLETAAAELEEISERIRTCAVGACPVLADLALRDFD